MPSSPFTPDSLPNLVGRVYLVTGGNAGIGKATVVELASHGAKVYVGARSESKALAAIEEIRAMLPSTNIEFLLLDLTDFRSVISAAKRLRSQETTLHGLINNAGIMGVPFSLTTDGYEVQFQTNYLSHWLLTFHLLPLLQSTAATAPEGLVRIINVTSDGHARFAPKNGINFDDTALQSESAMLRYGQSKLANVLHAKQLHKDHGPNQDEDVPQKGKIYVAAVHPGHIDTNLNKQATGTAPSPILRVITPIMRCLGILDDSAKGAWSSLFAVASNDFKSSDSGSYVVPYAKIGTPSAFAKDEELAGKLWAWTKQEFGAKGSLEL
ncbi:Fc.00g104210.m01.CDS01 [Cosmosporella sp. VM-42]